MVFGKLFKKEKGDDPLQLIVEGTVTESGRHQPRTRLGPNAAAEEAWLGLELTAATLSDGTDQGAGNVWPPEFTGPLGLLQQFPVGSKVRITCSTASGRQIEKIESVST